MNRRFDNGSKMKILSIRTFKGFELIDYDSILYLEADTSYTTFFLTDNTKITAAKNLGYFEKRLSLNLFIRIHHSTIINLTKVKRCTKAGDGYVIIIDQKTLPVSRTRKSFLLERLKQLC
jgi:two-component system LytT family response regulator